MMRSPRARITAAFLAATVIGLTVVGFIMHAGLSDRLVDSLDEVLEDRGTATARLLVQRGEVRPGLTEGLDDPGESFTQVVGPDGRLQLSSPGLPLSPILDAEQRVEASDEGLDVRLTGVAVDREDEDGEEIDLDALEETGVEPFETDLARVRAARVALDDGTYWIITGTTYEDHDEALRDLTTVLWICGPIALVLIGLAGFFAVGRALRPLHAALAHERALVADVSHELRTPLTVISGELELALQPGVDRAESEESVRIAAAEAQRLGRLGEDLLLLARHDAEQLELRREPMDALELLEATKRRFATAGEIAVQAAPGATINADRVRVEQALGNLIDNAFAYGTGGVRLIAREDEIVVHNDGDGFPAEVLPRAFERFGKGREGRTGLGLAIVDVVARAHGGSVSAANVAGGAEVTLRFS